MLRAPIAFFALLALCGCCFLPYEFGYYRELHEAEKILQYGGRSGASTQAEQLTQLFKAKYPDVSILREGKYQDLPFKCRDESVDTLYCQSEAERYWRRSCIPPLGRESQGKQRFAILIRHDSLGIQDVRETYAKGLERAANDCGDERNANLMGIVNSVRATS